MKTLKLNSGHDIPIVGLGTWRAQPEETEKAVHTALEAGYKHIDTAFNYNTEESIGEVVKKWTKEGKTKREDLFITTKLPHVGNRPKDVGRYLQMSLERLQMNYVDLYLVHMPFSFLGNPETHAPLTNEDGTFRLDVDNDVIGTWAEMEKQVEQGKAKSIGLSNFNLEQIEKICLSCKIKPSVLQVEHHAYLQQPDLVERCKKLGIVVTAYSPLGSPGANQHFSSKYNYELEDFPDILGHPTVGNLSEKYGKTPGQILLRHITQKGIVVIPKSLNPKRIKDNIDIFDFELIDDDIRMMNDLDRGEKGRIFDFLFFKGVEKHPEYPFKQRLTVDGEKISQL
ncbi:aldo-keto reductase family 1 member A1-A-like isoform X2 [Harmonia axyridis]|nr:aldo-keto reductase family 1 member A1-A-like isoform X2 [Harmonia axyridis]XP_045478115.1 aldo-keto reductase family 1 member A1-A-like isoform X2 [Harmonia axyridis]